MERDAYGGIRLDRAAGASRRASLRLGVGLEDHLGTRGGSRFWKRRLNVWEWSYRPLVSLSPMWLQNAIFKAITPIRHARFRLTGYDKDWRMANTEHSLRDWLSPRYARRYGFNEVMEWFRRGWLLGD